MPLYNQIASLLGGAIDARSPFMDEKHQAAFRLFNGFTEGYPDISIDVYGRTLLLHDYAKERNGNQPAVELACRFALSRLDWITCAIVKSRHDTDPATRNGVIVHGSKPDNRVVEHGVKYAVDLQMNRDAGLYLDTRTLRRWAMDHLAGKSVLNTFAYTGSLGVAATAAGASRVVHTDLNKSFLNEAKRSHTLNGFPIQKSDFIAGDFFPVVKRLSREHQRFDCVFLDPPFFSTTRAGTVDLEKNTVRLVNKVRPLVNNDGCVVVVNNALFLSGEAFTTSLEELCADGYVTIESRIDVAPDFVGTESTRTGTPPVDPSPFNHSTKMAVLRITHKS